MKSKRHEKILELIRDNDIETQEQLLQQLQESGFNTTQATISRDIKQLRIIKELGPNGTYRYSASAKPVEHAFSSKLNIIFSQCVTSVDYAQNIIVIKTLPGLAMAACSALDKIRPFPRWSGRWAATIRAWSFCGTLPRRPVSARRSAARSRPMLPAPKNCRKENRPC